MHLWIFSQLPSALIYKDTVDEFIYLPLHTLSFICTLFIYHSFSILMVGRCDLSKASDGFVCAGCFLQTKLVLGPSSCFRSKHQQVWRLHLAKQDRGEADKSVTSPLTYEQFSEGNHLISDPYIFNHYKIVNVEVSAFISGKIIRLTYWLGRLNAERYIYLRGLCRRGKSCLCLILEAKTNPPTQNFFFFFLSLESSSWWVIKTHQYGVYDLSQYEANQSQPVLGVSLRSDVLSLVRMKSLLLSTVWVDMVQHNSRELGEPCVVLESACGLV